MSGAGSDGSALMAKPHKRGPFMRVIVCGGRDFRSPAQVFRALEDLHARMPITELMQGGATGADRFAQEWATTKPEIKRYVCRAEWGTYGKAAGPMRNQRMIEWKPDVVVAFPGGRGTADMVKRADSAGITVLQGLPGAGQA